jgi:hypothetical protein
MTVFLGQYGNIRLKRGSKTPYAYLEENIDPADVNTNLNRLGFDTAIDNLLIGDRITITTTDPRGLVCFDPNAWSSGEVESSLSAFIHVNAVGGLRFFSSFEAAVNNVRSEEFELFEFTGDPINAEIRVTDARANVLGNVTGYTINTDRESIDATALSDKFRRQYSAGLISGNGSIDCLFDYKTTGIEETPLLMLQLLQRIDIGSEFDLALYLTDKELTPTENNVFYEMEAMVTRTGVTVTTDNTINCTIDFVTTGDIRLLVGEPVGYVLKEDDDRIELEQSLDFLLVETED